MLSAGDFAILPKDRTELERRKKRPVENRTGWNMHSKRIARDRLRMSPDGRGSQMRVESWP